MSRYKLQIPSGVAEQALDFGIWVLELGSLVKK
jgi:hypothetical protein